MPRTVLWSIGFFLASALGGQTTAAPPPVVYEIAKVVARPVDSTAVAVSVVDRSAIEASGAATVAEVLPFLPGVTLLSGGTRGGLTAVQLRGGDLNFTRVLIDGVPCNDGTAQVGEVFNLEGVPAVGVERIEVVRGPLSAVYGSTGLAGAINVVTRRGEGPLRGELSASAGQAHERGGAVWLGGGGARADGFLSGVRQEERERIAEERFDLSQLSGQGRPDLRPEVALGADLGIEHRIERASLALGVGMFLSRFRDLVDFDFETFRHVNRSRVEARGVELSAAWQPPRRVSLQASATWQEVEDERSGAPLRHRPRWAGGLRLTDEPAARWQLALDLRFSSGSFDEQIPVPERRTVSGYALLGGAVSWQAAPAWRLALRLDNLTDERYETLIGFPGAGRSARLTVARGFGAGR